MSFPRPLLNGIAALPGRRYAICPRQRLSAFGAALQSCPALALQGKSPSLAVFSPYGAPMPHIVRLPAHRLLFYTIGRVPPRINTVLHSGFVLRQPPPHHIRASDFSQARWYPDRPRNFSALRRYVGRIRFFIHSRSQPNNYYSSCRFRTAHRKDHFRRLTLRAATRQEVTPMARTVGNRTHRTRFWRPRRHLGTFARIFGRLPA